MEIIKLKGDKYNEVLSDKIVLSKIEKGDNEIKKGEFKTYSFEEIDDL